MFKKIAFYIKVGRKLVKRDVVNNEDYRIEYNKLACTYSNWLSKMGEFTERIIKPEYLPKQNELKILDFACGTGYISKSLLDKNVECEITAVDASEEMLDKLKSLNNSGVKIVNCDGIEFLKNTEEKYDAIFFGWALSYFNHKELFGLFRRVLNDKGIIAIITNTRGTLAGIEDIFLKVMYKNHKEVIKPMDISFNLPYGKKGLTKWFKRYGFELVEAEDGEVIVTFDTPEQLLQWLNETGAAAGTGRIFKNYSLVKDNLIDEIRKEKYKHGKYEINHKFAYGIFRAV